jgi:hypothetical protein
MPSIYIIPVEGNGNRLVSLYEHQYKASSCFSHNVQQSHIPSCHLISVTNPRHTVGG